VEEVRFGLLGSLEVWADALARPLFAPRHRTLLASLLFRANQVVACDDLVDTLWDGQPPGGAAVTLRGYVMRVRRTLGPAGRRIETIAPGYRINLDPEHELDAARFEALCRGGLAAGGSAQWKIAAALLNEALALWRGEPLQDVPCERLRDRELPGLLEAHVQAEQAWLQAEIELGRPEAAVAGLGRLVAAHPLRERPSALLMTALEGCDRRVEALEVFRDLRARLTDELGIEPSGELQDLHRAILVGRPETVPARPPRQPDQAPFTLPAAASDFAGREAAALAAYPQARAVIADELGADPGPASPGAPAAAQRHRATPRQLPGPVPHFLGRADELRRLSESLDQATDATAVWVIGGTAGVGKTALAVRWAHRVSGRFPDGQLYANLRGYDRERPVTAADALAGFLRALGVAGQDIPPGTDERAALYRSLLAGRRMLVVLDNAGDDAQVRPLLPGAPPCVTVVTSRDTLAGLVVREGARRLDLGLLPQADAAGLLRALIGVRAAADPGATQALACLCARLPLALRLAAELAATRGGARLADLVAELAGGPRLDLLDAGGNPRTAVRAVFSWSYRHLDAGTARMFRLLSLHPGADLDVYAAAALAGLTAERAAGPLDRLVRAHLIDTTQPGRYGLHDLLRAYARELAAEGGPDSQDEPRSALTRLFDYYLHATAEAMGTLFPAERRSCSGLTPPATSIPPVTGRPDAARAWLDAQRAALTAVAAHTAEHGWPRHTIGLATTVFRYLEGGGHCPEAAVIHAHARRAAQLTGDLAAEAAALTSLGLADARQGRYQRAASQFQQALALSRQAGDQADEARALGNLGIVRYQQGRYQQAASHYRQALRLFRELGDQTGEASALTSLANVALRQGRYQQAASHLRKALALYRDSGNRSYEAYALQILGLVDLRTGRCPQAMDRSHEALELARQTGNRGCAAYALANLGAIELCQGRYQQAADHQRQALAMFCEIGDRSGAAQARNGLGCVFLATGHGDHARGEHATALALARRIGDKYEQARAHDGLGQAHYALGDRRPAGRHWQRAFALYAELGAPEAARVYDRLAGCREEHRTARTVQEGP
jgi:DNA-binding SARP family transcriptional activator/tetratricopeptide (TPR) repeat protein